MTFDPTKTICGTRDPEEDHGQPSQEEQDGRGAPWRDRFQPGQQQRRPLLLQITQGMQVQEPSSVLREAKELQARGRLRIAEERSV